jgi:peptide/nickel transport system ATP-binding protein
MDRFPHEVSGGEAQRVNLARALASGPRFLVADEISASLDPISQAQVWRLLLAAVRTRDIGVLAISHDRPLLDVVADRVVDLADLSA